jgi:putative colanic acid biosynthesis acetyltransferase WcaF
MLKIVTKDELVGVPPPSRSDKLKRLLWRAVWILLCRFTLPPFHQWRVWILRLFGARIGTQCAVYPDVRIWAPWNVALGDHVTVGPGVDLYSVGPIKIEDFAIISQRSFLCTATHDHNGADFALQIAPIHVGGDAWIAAEAYIAPGIEIGAGAVVGARAVVTKSVPPRAVVAGNPARIVAERSGGARNYLKH